MNKEALRKKFEDKLFNGRAICHLPGTQPPSVEQILAAPAAEALALTMLRWTIFYNYKLPQTWDSYWAAMDDVKKTQGRFNLSPMLIDALVCHPNPHATELAIRHQTLDKQQLAIALNRQYTADYWTMPELVKIQKRKSGRLLVEEAQYLGYDLTYDFEREGLPKEFRDRFVTPFGITHVDPSRRRVFLFMRGDIR